MADYQMECLKVFLSSSRQMPGYYLKLGHTWLFFILSHPLLTAIQLLTALILLENIHNFRRCEYMPVLLNDMLRPTSNAFSH
jgi:hypothetical protein